MLIAASAHQTGMAVMAVVLVIGIVGGLIYSTVSGRRRSDRDRRDPDA
jgi:hypothetical protein